MRSAVIVDAIRTASGKGKPGGALSSLPVAQRQSLMEQFTHFLACVYSCDNCHAVL